MRPDDDANQELYGRRIAAPEIREERGAARPAGRALVGVLKSATPQDLAAESGTGRQRKTVLAGGADSESHRAPVAAGTGLRGQSESHR